MKELKDYFTKEQEKRMSRGLLALAEKDPVFFASHFLGIPTNSFQKRFLRSYIGGKQLMTVTGNQTGKTVALAIVHLWQCYFKVGFEGSGKVLDSAMYETLNLSPVSRQAKQCAQYIRDIMNNNMTWVEGNKRKVNKCKVQGFFTGENKNKGRMDFANNSCFWCLSTGQDQGAGIQGKQFASITYDECVQSHHLEEELSARIMSRTAKYAGRMSLIATPDDLAPSQQYWYHLYQKAKRQKKDGVVDPDWGLVTGTYDENEFIPKKNREEFKKRLKKTSPVRYEQVIKGKFVASSDRMFGLTEVEGLWNGKEKPTDPIKGHEYIIPVDWGVADQGDETVMLVADITDLWNVEIVNAYHKQGGDPIEMMAMLQFLSMDYNDAQAILEVTEMGGTVFKKMLSRMKPITFGQGDKPDALFYLAMRLRNNVRGKENVKDIVRPAMEGLTLEHVSDINKLKSYYLPKLEQQLSTYKLPDKAITQDWVITIAILAWYVDKHKRASRVKSYSLKDFYGNRR